MESHCTATPPLPPSLPCMQRQRRLAVWSILAQPAQGFVAVTPLRWPGGGGGAQVRLGTGRTLMLCFPAAC